MGFTEKTHAYLSAKYYRYLTGLFGDRGLQAFIHATRHYAMQRGQRMAQRAIRDGRALTQETYNQYGEWLPTDEITSLGQQNKKRCENDAMYVQQCPWKAMFDEMNAGECRDVYCSVLDSAISRGFNPDLGYHVDVAPADGSICIHRLDSGDISAGSGGLKRTEYARSFEYHCAHLYWAYAEVSRAIFGAEGEEVCRSVLADFARDYGQPMADALKQYERVNFNVCE